MIQFNLNRFGKLAKWSLTIDKGFYERNLLNVFVVLSLFFIAFTTRFFHIYVNDNDSAYTPCLAATMIMFIITVVTGPAWMFSSMKGKHDLQTLLMLPASNFEKYLMRYSTWMILLPLYIVAFLGADLVQYLVNVLRDGEHVTFVTTVFIDHVSALLARLPYASRNLLYGIITCVFLFHSLYALGGTFFRSHKYSWVMTTVSIIVLSMVILWLSPESSEGSVDKEYTTMELIAWDALYGAWFLLNFWLSYRLFCRQQVIGKFVNL